MHDVDELLKAVKAAEAAGDPEQLDAARAKYLEADPSGADAAEQRYRFGLVKLFRTQDRNGALELFKAAANEKGAPIAPEARVSLALLLHGTGKRQQAMFELKKMVPQGCAASIHTVQALDFLSLVMRETGQPSGEIMAMDQQRIEHLSALAKAAKDPVEKAHYILRHAAAHADGGTATDLQLARKKYDEVVKLGAKAGESALQAARAALKILPR